MAKTRVGSGGIKFTVEMRFREHVTKKDPYSARDSQERLFFRNKDLAAFILGSVFLSCPSGVLHIGLNYNEIIPFRWTLLRPGGSNSVV